VLDALASAGFSGDGRLLALNSYENRVYQAWLEAEETPNSPASVVAKFYRPARWTDAQILEEHAFTLELASARFRWSRRSRPTGRRCTNSAASASRVSAPRRSHPELEDRDTLEWMGRFIGRIHAVGATRSFARRPVLDVESFGREPRDWLLAHDFIPADLLEAWKSAGRHGARGRRTRVRARRRRARAAPARRLPRGQRLVDRRGPALRRFRRLRSGSAIQDLWMLLSGDRESMTRQLTDVLAGYQDFHEFDPRELHLLEVLRPCASSTTRPGSRGAGTTPRSRRHFPGSTRSATGRTASSS